MFKALNEILQSLNDIINIKGKSYQVYEQYIFSSIIVYLD